MFLVQFRSLLGGSWVVISRVISRVTILIPHIRGLITLLITTHEPPSNPTKACRSQTLGSWVVSYTL